MHAVKAKLDGGASLDDIAASLASSLATQVAALLGVPVDVAKHTLTQAFATALKPTDTGPPQTNAERASTLVQRFRQIAGLATRVTNEDSGQPIRLIAGQRSDAEQAGATPALATDSLIREATQALAGSASAILATPSASTTPATVSAPAESGDGRLVTLPPAQAIATGGDTPLGRILTRAALPELRRATPIAAVDPDAARAATTTTPTTATAPAAGAEAPVLAPPTVATTTATTAGTKALDAFVQAFTAAVAHADGTPPKSSDGTATLVTVPVDGSQQSSLLTFAVPAVTDAAPIQPPTQASTLPQPQHVDAGAVVDQVLRGISPLRTSDGSSQIQLRLQPESLGDVTVKLVVSGGSVDATITTHSADAQNVLAGAQNQLAKTLADAGLKLQSFNVGLAGGAFADARDQQQTRSWADRNARRINGVAATDADESDDAVDPSLLAIPSFGPSIYTADGKHGDFSYLV